jgi:hypothetical protein
MGVHLIGMHLMGVHVTESASRRRVSHRHGPLTSVQAFRFLGKSFGRIPQIPHRKEPIASPKACYNLWASLICLSYYLCNNVTESFQKLTLRAWLNLTLLNRFLVHCDQ